MNHDDGTEADYMYACQMSELGADDFLPDPEFEVVSTKNKKMFVGGRADCWAFKRSKGGYVRKFTGYDDDFDDCIN